MNVTYFKQYFQNIGTKKHIKISFNKLLLYFLEFSTCHNEQHDSKIIHIFINTQQIFMFNVSMLIIFYEKYDWSSHSMIKCKFKKVNNWTTTTYAPMGAFDYTTNGVTMPVHSCMTPWELGSGQWSWYELTHNTPKHFHQTCHKINSSIVPYKTVDD